MAILVDANTRVICQGLTGSQGTRVQKDEEIIDSSGLGVISADDPGDAAEKILKAVRG